MGVSSGKPLLARHDSKANGWTKWIYTASGPVIDLAARLASVAAAGQIIVGPEMVSRLGRGYLFENLGPQQLRNIAEPVCISRALGPLRHSD
jgi:class 3 adenylate cyclase